MKTMTENPRADDWHWDSSEPPAPRPVRVSARYGRPAPAPAAETPCLDTLIGRARGLAAKMRDQDAEIDAWYAARSPCGVHMYPTERDACERCAEHDRRGL